MDGQAGERLHQLACKPADRGIGQLPGCNCKCALYLPCQFFITRAVDRSIQGLLEFIDEQAHHAHSVFQLDITVIALLFRELPPCRYIPLVACMDEVKAELMVEFLLAAFYHVNHIPCLFFGIQSDGEQVVPELGDSGRHNRNAP